MKKLNKKGFVLAESIVVSVFVLGIFTYLAVNVIPLVTQYDRAINYDNPQEVYAANILFEEMNAYWRQYQFDSAEWTLFSDRHSKVINFFDVEKDYFKELMIFLDIKSISIVEENCDLLGRGMTEYCNYLKEKKEFESLLGFSVSGAYVGSFDQKIIIVQFENNKFANFKAYEKKI